MTVMQAKHTATKIQKPTPLPVKGWVELDRELSGRITTDRARRHQHYAYSRVTAHDIAVTALGAGIIGVESVSTAQNALLHAIDELPLTRQQKDRLEETAFGAINAERKAMAEAWLDAHGYAALDAAFGRGK